MGFLLNHLNNTLTANLKWVKSTAIPRAFILLLCYVDCDCKLNTCVYEDATKGPREDLGSEQSCAFAILKRIFSCVVH